MLGGLGSGQFMEICTGTERRNVQEVSDDVGEEYAEGMDITILLEEVVEILKVSK